MVLGNRIWGRQRGNILVSISVPKMGSDSVPKLSSDSVPKMKSDSVPKMSTDSVPKLSSDFVPQHIFFTWSLPGELILGTESGLILGTESEFILGTESELNLGTESEPILGTEIETKMSPRCLPQRLFPGTLSNPIVPKTFRAGLVALPLRSTQVWGGEGLVSLCFLQEQDVQYIPGDESYEATHRPGQGNCREENLQLS
jgi:hypothetical protein